MSKKYNNQEVNHDPQGNLVVPADVQIKRTPQSPALEMTAKKTSSKNPVCLFASPPKKTKDQCRFFFSNSNTLLENPVYFFKTEPNVGLLPKKSQNCVVLNLKDNKIVVRFYQDGKFSESTVGIKLSQKALDYFAKQASGKIDLEKDGQIVNPILAQALKEANRLHNSFARELGHVQYAQSSLSEDKKETQHQYNIPIEYVFDKDTEVVARPIPNQDPATPQVYEVRVIVRIKEEEEKSIRAFRPELLENIETVATGFMYGSDLQPTRKHFKPSSEPLFTTKPHPHQTKQRSLSNCFLLSAIEAILHTEGGPEFIMGMMKQDEKGITVRLYERNSKGEFSPVFVHVPNEVLYGNNFFSSAAGLVRASWHEGGLWLHALESAYAILGMDDYETRETFAPSYLSRYGSGGYSHIAMQALTGVEANNYLVIPENTATSDSNLFPKFKTKLLLAELEKLEENKTSPELYQEIISKQLPKDSLLRFLLQNDDNKIILFLQQIKKICQTNPEFIKKFSILDHIDKSVVDQKGFQTAITTIAIPELESIVKKFDESARNQLMPCLDPNKEMTYEGHKFYLFEGPLFSGQYTLHQLNIFEKISQALQEKSLVTANTFSENSPPGLADSHAYTIVGCETIGGKHFISVRNPWNFYSLAYSESRTGEVVRTRNLMNGVSKIELGDFCRFIKSYDIGKAPKVSSLGLNTNMIPKLNQQLKVDQLNQVVSYLESGFITYNLLQSNIDEKTSSQLLTEQQKLFINQELGSYIDPFKNFLVQRITALNEILPISDYQNKKGTTGQKELKTPIPGEDTGAFNDEIRSLLDPEINLPMEKSGIVKYLKAISQNENPKLRSYATALLLLIEQVKQLETSLIGLQSSTQLSTAVVNSKDYVETFKKIPRLVEEITYLSRSINQIMSTSTVTLFASTSKSEITRPPVCLTPSKSL